VLSIPLIATWLSLVTRGVFAPSLTEDNDCAMVLGARDCVVEQSAQMFRASGDGMRPEYDNVRKLAVLGALDSHGEMAPVRPKTQPRAVADGFMNELPHLPSGKSRLPLHPAQGASGPCG
jgi:hypothetical protein